MRALSVTFHLTPLGRILLVVTMLLVFLALRADGTGAQSDDHGNFLNNATPITLGASVAGRINSGDDRDVFRLDLSGLTRATDLWVYTTGQTDTLGGLYNSAGRPIVVNQDSGIVGRLYNFHVRAKVTRGIYYVAVIGGTKTVTGPYRLHTETVLDPGNTLGTAKQLRLAVPTAGTIGSPNDRDYFRLQLTEPKHLYLYALSLTGKPLGILSLDGQSRTVATNVYPWPNGVLIRDDFQAGTYYFRVFTYGSGAVHPAPYTIHAVEDVWYTDFLTRCQNATAQLNAPQVQDSLYGCQWHLRNQNGQDINVESVWEEGITGEGVNISVVDDGMDFYHEDLRENVDTSRNHNYWDRGSIFSFLRHHGTKVAGVLAARDNGIGVRGVAPRATIYGYNHLANPTTLNTGDALVRNFSTTAVSNNSWGFTDHPGVSRISTLWRSALETGIRSGYGNRGTFYAFGAGGGHRNGDYANLTELLTHRGVTAVCAVNDGDVRASYSEVGPNLWICAPSGELRFAKHREIVTTDNYDRYDYLGSGTSMSTPIVSGVAALMRDANPNLTWRDLKLILAASARKNDPGNSGWLVGSRKYGADSSTERYHFNHSYGFGVVDAAAAVALAKNWRSLPPLMTSSVNAGALNASVPDAPLEGPPRTVTYTLGLDGDIEFTEFVEINVDFNHGSFRDLTIDLVSPSGTASRLTFAHDAFTPNNPNDIDFFPLRGWFRLGSARHLGEDPNGTWTLRITDHLPGPQGARTFRSWGLTVYGHASPTVGPQVEANFAQPSYSVTEGGSVAVAVSLSADPQRTVTVPIVVTHQGGATAADYSGVPESVTFVSGGLTRQTFNIAATDDQIADANESLKLAFGALPVGVSLGATAETTLTITDNDGVPTVQMSLTETPRVRLRVGVPVSVVFSQAVSGFGIDDLTVANGYVQNLAGEAGGTNYSFDVVPTAIGAVTVDLAAGAAQNSQGQGNLATPQLLVGLPYDDNHNGVIGPAEVLVAVSDYFSGRITVPEVLAVVSRYFSEGG